MRNRNGHVRSRLDWISLALGLCYVLPLQAATFPYEAEAVKIEDLTPDTKLVRFKLAPGSQESGFTPGKFLLMKVPDDFVKEWDEKYKTSHREVSRPYSLASSSSRLPLFDLIIKQALNPPGKDAPPGLASTFVHKRLKVGDVVRFSEPMGSLYLGIDPGRPIIIVAGGAGIAPFLSLLEYWFESNLNKKNEILLFFGVRSKRDLFLDERFREWASTKKNFRYIPALSHPAKEDDWKGETGYIQIAVDKYVPSPSPAEAYIAGPLIMLKEVRRVLNAKGITDERIHHDPITVE